MFSRRLQSTGHHLDYTNPNGPDDYYGEEIIWRQLVWTDHGNYVIFKFNMISYGQMWARDHPIKNQSKSNHNYIASESTLDEF